MSNPMNHLDQAIARANRRLEEAKKAAAPRMTPDAFRKDDHLADGTVKPVPQPKKPPLGVCMRSVHEAMRLQDIEAAIARYAAEGFSIPPEWKTEHEELWHRVSRQVLVESGGASSTACDDQMVPQSGTQHFQIGNVGGVGSCWQYPTAVGGACYSVTSTASQAVAHNLRDGLPFKHDPDCRSGWFGCAQICCQSRPKSGKARQAGPLTGGSNCSKSRQSRTTANWKTSEARLWPISSRSAAHSSSTRA